MRKIEIGKVYRHFKNKYYVVIDIVNDCESNNEAEYRKVVIYKALYGEHLTWARPYEMFNSEVDHVKYPEVEQKYRFEEVEVDTNEFIDLLKMNASIINAWSIGLEKTINPECEEQEDDN